MLVADGHHSSDPAPGRVGADKENSREFRGRKHDHCQHGAGCRTLNRCVALEPIVLRHHLHGDDRQPAVWLESFRQSDRRKHHWGRAEIQVAFTLFVLTETWLIPVEGWFVDRFGPRARGDLRRHSGRHRLDDQFVCDSLAAALRRAPYFRHRRRRGLRDLRRQCTEMVFRPARPCRRPDRRGLRRRCGADRGADPG